MTSKTKTAKAPKAEEILVAPKAMQPVKPSELLRSEAKIKAFCTALGTDGVSYQRRIHIAACSILRRIGESNDIRLINALLVNMPGAARVNALREWFSAYGPVAWEKNKPVFVKGKQVELTKALSDPFWEFAPEPEYVPVDVAKLIAAAVKKLTTDQTKTGKNHGPVIAALEAAANAGKAPAVATEQAPAA